MYTPEHSSAFFALRDDMSPRPRLRILSFLLLAVALVTVAAACGSGSTSAASSGIEPGTGGRATLGDVSITIPAGAVPSRATLDISNDGHAPSSLLGADGAGPEFHATLDQPLSGPAEISVTVPSAETEPDSLFLAYYDETTSKWIPVPGSVSAGRLTVKTEHFSWWKVWKWNWSSWRADLKSALSLQITEWIQGFQNLTTECDKKGKAGVVTSDDSAAHGIIQGCVTDDSSSPAHVRIFNDKAFFLDVTSSNDPSNPKLLGSGDSLDINVDTSQQPPLQITVSITQDAAWRTVAEMALRLLPAKELLGVKSIAVVAIGSLADALAAIPESKDAFDDLMAGHSAAAAEKIYALLTKETTIETITNWAIQFGQSHGISTLTTWTKAAVKGALLGVAAADVIVTWTDFIPNYLLGSGSYVRFGWSAPVLSPSPTPSPNPPVDTARAPTAPSNVRLAALGDGKIRVTWQDNSDNEDGFRILAADPPAVAAEVGPNVTSADVCCGGVTIPNPEGNWCFMVEAFNTVGASSLSEMACGNFPGPASGPPSPPSAVHILHHGSADIAWSDNSQDEEGFNIYRACFDTNQQSCTSDGEIVGEYRLVATAPSHSTTYAGLVDQFVNAPFSVAHDCWAVAAFNQAGESSKVVASDDQRSDWSASGCPPP